MRILIDFFSCVYLMVVQTFINYISLVHKRQSSSFVKPVLIKQFNPSFVRSSSQVRKILFPFCGKWKFFLPWSHWNYIQRFSNTVYENKPKFFSWRKLCISVFQYHRNCMQFNFLLILSIESFSSATLSMCCTKQNSVSLRRSFLDESFFPASKFWLFSEPATWVLHWRRVQKAKYFAIKTHVRVSLVVS